MIPQLHTNPINIFANDPNARGLGLVQVVPPIGRSPFAIPGWTGAGGLFAPGTPEFGAGELYVMLTRTYATWADFFGTDFVWQPGFAQLPIVPRAGEDLNAYYDRTGLKFFFSPNRVTGQNIYTSESADIIAHECGHAVLDAHHPEYWDSLLAETAAFHEAFGDISAILVALDDPAVRAAILVENDGDLAKSNAVTRLAEQLARGFFDVGKTDAVVSPDTLRDVVNKFRYRDPDQLPARAPASHLSSESHSFSRVFSGAFYDLLIGIYEQWRRAGPNSRSPLPPDAALAQARSDAGHLLAQGLTFAPAGDATFKAIAVSMFTADAQNFGGRYFAPLRKALVKRRIIRAREADALKTARGVVHAQTSALGTARVPVDATLRVGAAIASLGAALPSRIRHSLQLAQQGFRLVGEFGRRDATRVLHFAAPHQMQLRGEDLGVARGAIVTMTDTLAVHVDGDGRVLSSHQHQMDPMQEKRIHDHVAKLVARGRIYEARAGETIDPADLIARKQPYYVTYDQAGNRQIRRAFIACGIE